MDIPEVDKLTWSQVCDIIKKYHTDNDIHYCTKRENLPYLRFRVVFDPTASNWPKYYKKWDETLGKSVDDLNRPRTYTEESCTYEFDDGQKYWFDDLIGNSLFACCLDKNDLDSMGIKLEQYLGSWKILYCYQVKPKTSVNC